MLTPPSASLPTLPLPWDAGAAQQVASWVAVASPTASIWAALQAAGWLEGPGGEALPQWVGRLEALAAHDAGSAAMLWAHGAASVAWRCSIEGSEAASVAAALPPRQRTAEGLGWPAFHGLGEQLWPELDALGHLRGHVQLVLLPPQAQQLVLPVRTRERGHVLARVHLGHPAVSLGDPVRASGLRDARLHDIELHGVPARHLGAAAVDRLPAQAAGVAGVGAMALLCGVARAALGQAWASRQALSQAGPVADTLWQQQWQHQCARHATMRGLLLGALALVAASDTDTDPWALEAMRLQAGEAACALTEDVLAALPDVDVPAIGRAAAGVHDAHLLHQLGGSPGWRRQMA